MASSACASLMQWKGIWGSGFILTLNHTGFMLRLPESDLGFNIRQVAQRGSRPACAARGRKQAWRRRRRRRRVGRPRGYVLVVFLTSFTSKSAALFIAEGKRMISTDRRVRRDSVLEIPVRASFILSMPSLLHRWHVCACKLKPQKTYVQV